MGVKKKGLGVFNFLLSSFCSFFFGDVYKKMFFFRGGIRFVIVRWEDVNIFRYREMTGNRVKKLKNISAWVI